MFDEGWRRCRRNFYGMKMLYLYFQHYYYYCLSMLEFENVSCMSYVHNAQVRRQHDKSFGWCFLHKHHSYSVHLMREFARSTWPRFWLEGLVHVTMYPFIVALIIVNAYLAHPLHLNSTNLSGSKTLHWERPKKIAPTAGEGFAGHQIKNDFHVINVIDKFVMNARDNDNDSNNY